MDNSLVSENSWLVEKSLCLRNIILKMVFWATCMLFVYVCGASTHVAMSYSIIDWDSAKSDLFWLVVG